MDVKELGRDRRDGRRRRPRQAKPGEWILGRGWHQEKWRAVPKPNVEGFPFHDALSKVSPDNPVMLDARQRPRQLRQRQGDGGGRHHRATRIRPAARSQGCAAAGRSACCARRRPDLAERRYDGVAREEDARGTRRRRAPADRTRRAGGLEKGITSFQDAGANFATIDVHQAGAADDGALGIRLWVMVRDSNENLAAKLPHYKAVGLDDNHLTIAAIKMTIDGALGSRGAWMLEPYSDSPTSIGLRRRLPESIAETARHRRSSNGVQLVRARDRRSRQPRGARTSTSARSRRSPIGEGLALAHRARAAPRTPPTSRASASSA